MGPNELDAVGADRDLDGDSSLSARPGRPARPGLLVALLAGALALLLVVAAWLLTGSRTPPPAARIDEVADPSTADRDTPRDTQRSVARATTVTPDPSSTTAVVPGGVGDAAADAELPHPHPITPERERIQHENQLIGALNDAMDVRDGARLRQILATYREQYPEDPNFLQEGYRLIADCLEHPGAATTSAGQRYFDQQRGSILRRMVQRHCLGGR
jgi:hypothetical protein